MSVSSLAHRQAMTQSPTPTDPSDRTSTPVEVAMLRLVGLLARQAAAEAWALHHAPEEEHHHGTESLKED